MKVLSSDESEGEPMEVTYNIPGEATGAVMGKGRTTLHPIKEYTGCIDVNMGGSKGDKYAPVKIQATNMNPVALVKKIVKKLVRAHTDLEEVWHQTLLVKHDDRWGAKMPDNSNRGSYPSAAA